MSAPDSKLPLIASLFCTLLGLLIGFISGIKSGSMGGGIIAGLGMIPACYAMWLGIQDRESQAQQRRATAARNIRVQLAWHLKGYSSSQVAGLSAKPSSVHRQTIGA